MALCLFPGLSRALEHEDRPPYVPPSPVAVWLTPSAGLYGKTYGAGAGLQAALPMGPAMTLQIDGGEEFCIFCGHVPERFYAGSFMLGLRKVGRIGYGSIAAGPSWGSGIRTVPGAQPTPDTTCGFSSIICFDDPPPTETYEGVGFQLQAQGALAWRFLGVGMNFHLLYIPKRALAGVSLMVPVGVIK